MSQFHRVLLVAAGVTVATFAIDALYKKNVNHLIIVAQEQEPVLMPMLPTEPELQEPGSAAKWIRSYCDILLEMRSAYHPIVVASRGRSPPFA